MVLKKLAVCGSYAPRVVGRSINPRPNHNYHHQPSTAPPHPSTNPYLQLRNFALPPPPILIPTLTHPHHPSLPTASPTLPEKTVTFPPKHQK